MHRPKAHRLGALVAAALSTSIVAAGCSGGQQNQTLEPATLSRVSPAISNRDAGPPAIAFMAPLDGDVVSSPFVVQVQTDNIDLAPAGFSRDGEGHFHIRIGNGCMPAGKVLPQEDNTLHVGSGASTSEVELEPGTYELCAQLGDGFHVAVNVTDTITVEVVE